MNTKKCNSCKKILEKEPYYTVGEIEYTIPGASFTKLIKCKSENYSTKEKRKESWISYSDLDFCEACWKKTGFSKWVKKG